ncbi:sigma-54 interaction domain-containing protein [Clostridium rectalis]|uniref:sigma-54 interaction domain-containing protein n=1 Tax=Clostridium rectalis TaxID=2040295 RepID=UPI000F62DCA2|nr:sigma 54-interacting transcriptional regulator [Clostridium rectalis]
MINNLSYAEKILQCLLENLEEGIHVVDSSGRTIYYNKSMGKVEGIEPKDVLGKRVNEYLEDVKENSSTLMKALKTKEKIEDSIQKYSNEFNKKVITINTTVPVIEDEESIAAIEIAKDMTQLKELTECIYKLQCSHKEMKKHYTFNDIYANGEEMKKIIRKAKRASISNSPILIYAETGCGKEVFAQSIHYDGIRRDKPFIPINCAAIPAALLEGMLFGTEKGSFTGAENKKGLFEQANKGTILLDEVNSMEPYLQSKLLRVLQDGCVRPIGSNKTIDVDVRIIATLNEEPEKLIESGKLRKDFYYRLSVISITIPPLRERKEDIKPMVENFIKYYNQLLGKEIKSIDKDVMEKFLQYDWPGNIRELRNTIESAMNMTSYESFLSQKHFECRVFNNLYNKMNLNIDSLNIYENFSLEDYIKDIEIKIIEKAFIESNYNISKASKKLNISRQNLQYKLKKYGIKK